MVSCGADASHRPTRGLNRQLAPRASSTPCGADAPSAPPAPSRPSLYRRVVGFPGAIFAHAAFEARLRTCYATAVADLAARCHGTALEDRWPVTVRLYAAPQTPAQEAELRRAQIGRVGE